MASASDLGCVEPRTIIEAHEAGRNQARARADLSDEVIGSQEAPTRLDYDHFQLCRGLHGQPGCEMRGKFTTRDQDFIAGPPVETGSHCCETRGCAGGNGDLFGCAPYQLCERGSNAVRQVKISTVRYGVREFLPFERLPRRMKRNAG